MFPPTFDVFDAKRTLIGLPNFPSLAQVAQRRVAPRGDRSGSKRGRSPPMEVQDAVVGLREIFGVRGHGSEMDACVKARKTGYSAIPVIGGITDRLLRIRRFAAFPLVVFRRDDGCVDVDRDVMRSLVGALSSARPRSGPAA
jgi:hypothetical protein